MSNPYEGTNYDDSGMPLGTETFDYGVYADMKRHNSVKTKTDPQVPFEEAKLDTDGPTRDDFLKELDTLSTDTPEQPNTINFEDISEKRQEMLETQQEKGLSAPSELPKKEAKGEKSFDELLDDEKKSQEDFDKKSKDIEEAESE